MIHCIRSAILGILENLDLVERFLDFMEVEGLCIVVDSDEVFHFLVNSMHIGNFFPIDTLVYMVFFALESDISCVCA